MALLAVGMLTAMLGISYLGEAGAQLWSAAFVAPEAVAALTLALFLRHVSRTQAPFIPPRLLHGRGFGVMNVINFLYGAAAFGLGALVPVYAIKRYGMDALAAGTLLTARGIGVIAVAAVAALALRRTGYRWPMYVGFAALTLGLLGLASRPFGMSAYAWLAIGAGLTGIAMGSISPAANNASLQLAPQHAAAIAAVRGTCRQAGGIVSISISTAILAKSAHPGLAMADIFAVFAAIIAVTIPLVRRVPEHRGMW
jgi:MFS family permease